MPRGKALLRVAAAVAAAVLVAILAPGVAPAVRAVFSPTRAEPPSAAAFVAAYFAVAFVSGPVWFVSSAAGYFFGAARGFALAWPAGVAAATSTFALARALGHARASALLARRPAAAAILDAAGRDGFRVTLLLRLAPVLPFGLINVALGVTRMRARTFVAANLAGFAAPTVAWCWAGATLRTALGDGFQPDASPAGRAVGLAGLVASAIVILVLGRAARRMLAASAGPTAALPADGAGENG